MIVNFYSNYNYPYSINMPSEDSYFFEKDYDEYSLYNFRKSRVSLLDDESFEDGTIFKLETDKFIINVMAILYMVSLMILGVVAWCMIEEKGFLWFFFVPMELFLAFFVYLFSKKVLKVKCFGI